MKALRMYSRFSFEQMRDESGVSRLRLTAIEIGAPPTLDEVRRISSVIEKSRVWSRQ